MNNQLTHPNATIAISSPSTITQQTDGVSSLHRIYMLPALRVRDVSISSVAQADASTDSTTVSDRGLGLFVADPLGDRSSTSATAADTTMIIPGTLLLLECPLLYVSDSSLTQYPEIVRVYGDSSESLTGIIPSHHALRLINGACRMLQQSREVQEEFSKLFCPIEANNIAQSEKLESSVAHHTFYPLRTRHVIAALKFLDLDALMQQLQFPSACVAVNFHTPSAPSPSQFPLSIHLSLSTLIRYILILDSNWFQVAPAEDGSYDSGAAIYSNFSRINHSCRPNSFHSSGSHREVWNGITSSNISMYTLPSSIQNHIPMRALYSTSTLLPGEEICISYLSHTGTLLHSTLERRKELMVERWFWCLCERCIGVDSARTFKCGDMDCPGVVLLQPRPSASLSRDVKTDFSSTLLNAVCTEKLCMEVLTPDDIERMITQERELTDEFSVLSAAITECVDPANVIHNFLKNVLSVTGKQHWIVYELYCMLREITSQIGSMKEQEYREKERENNEGKENESKNDPVAVPAPNDSEIDPDTDLDGTQSKREAIAWCEQEVELIRKCWMGCGNGIYDEALNRAKWPPSVHSADYRSQLLPPSGCAVCTGPYQFSEAVALERLSDCIFAVRYAHLEYYPYLLFLLSSSHLIYRTCLGPSHEIVHGVERKYNKLLRRFQSCAGPNCTRIREQEEQDEEVEASAALLHATAPTPSTPSVQHCPTCQMIVYCSDTCKQAAMEDPNGHKKRCALLVGCGFKMVPLLSATGSS